MQSNVYYAGFRQVCPNWGWKSLSRLLLYILPTFDSVITVWSGPPGFPILDVKNSPRLSVKIPQNSRYENTPMHPLCYQNRHLFTNYFILDHSCHWSSLDHSEVVCYFSDTLPPLVRDFLSEISIYRQTVGYWETRMIEFHCNQRLLMID